jgi:hypothetical protein
LISVTVSFLRLARTAQFTVVVASGLHGTSSLGINTDIDEFSKFKIRSHIAGAYRTRLTLIIGIAIAFSNLAWTANCTQVIMARRQIAGCGNKGNRPGYIIAIRGLKRRRTRPTKTCVFRTRRLGKNTRTKAPS